MRPPRPSMDSRNLYIVPAPAAYRTSYVHKPAPDSGADSRCQPWRAKRRLVIPGSREAALLTRRARSAPEGKQSRHPNTASSQW
ncbi:MAG: hypothetical protein RPU61_05105, partial [Candidatus Sedimenticola sp. (ex Thyasira tokunagai)]